MTPSNPSNSKPLIYRICDSLGVFHIVAPVNHTHEINEVSGLTDELNELWASTNEKANAEDVTEALAEKQNTLTFDSTPTANSTNPVTSGGVKTALDGKADAAATTAALAAKQDTLTFDSTPTLNSNNPVTSSGVHVAIEEKFKGIVPDIVTLTQGDSIELDELAMEANSIRRLIVLNDYTDAIQFPNIFNSDSLPVHISGDSKSPVEIASGEYVLATVFRINSSEHVHLNCYFVLFEGIFEE